MAAVLTIDWEGKSYEVDITRLSGDEYREVRRVTGLTMGALINGLENVEEIDADVLLVLLWAAKNRAGEPTLLSQLSKDVAPFDLVNAIGSAEVDVTPEEAPKAPAESLAPISRPDESGTSNVSLEQIPAT